MIGVGSIRYSVGQENSYWCLNTASFVKHYKQLQQMNTAWQYCMQKVAKAVSYNVREYA